ncbi:integrase [Reticulibacter mediterranei]|uniref:Integrase n=1 Tax=Reticulibacter mediterranei TaxID=2778369 RepID=A0A8J3MXS3_9CHLR|nr:tyrosine-type recombinase/integrase [Reticulibacter mediterranei]GHO90127.1 integrase [Reticulibacter mediterranei]
MDPSGSIRWEIFPRIAVLPSAQEWFQLQANRQLSPRTIEAYGRSLEDFLHFCEQHDPPLVVETATKVDLAAYVQDLVKRPNSHGQQIIHLHSGSGLSDQTIQLRLTAARLYYDHLVETGKQARNPVGRGKYTRSSHFSVGRNRNSANERPLVRRKPARQPWIPSDEQFKRLLAALSCESLRNQALFLLMYDSALRREELALLEMTDIDWAHREVTLRPETCKTSSGRLVLFTQATATRLRAYLERRRQIKPGLGRLFLSESDRNRASGLTPEMINKVMRSIARRANLPQFHPHTLHHLRLTHMARCGIAEHIIAEYAAHKSLDTTRLYIHMSGRDISAAVASQMEDFEAWIAATLEEVEG